MGEQLYEEYEISPELQAVIDEMRRAIYDAMIRAARNSEDVND